MTRWTSIAFSQLLVGHETSVADMASFEAKVGIIVEWRGYVTPAHAAKLCKVELAEAKKRLEAMYEAGQLELDLQGDEFVYKRPGSKKRGGAQTSESAMVEAAPSPAKELVTNAESAVADAAKSAMTDAAKSAMTDAAKKAVLSDVKGGKPRSVLWGIGLGFLLPGAGLFYAAPWITAVVSTVAVVIVLAILQVLPVVGGMLSYIVCGAFMFASAILGGTYAYQFNKHGQRTRLSKGSEDKRALPF